jgi:hypothetical protein
MKRFFRAALFSLVPLLSLAASLRGAGCTPVSASITYEADDGLVFYINGNQVLDGTVHDPGAPPVSVSIPPGFFNAGGTPNYFAAEVINTAANIVGGGWVISIQCSDGSVSYITDEDNTYTMYDDLNGSAPPPSNWYQPAYVDSPALFTGTPVLAPPIFWFNPAMTNPLTGNPLQVLSHSTSATQSSTAERLYFRQSVVLPILSPTPTPSPVPTYPPGCGVPNFQEAKVQASGCLGGTGTVTAPGSGTYSFTAQPNQLLVLRLCTSSSSSAPSNVKWGTQAMTLFAASNVGSSDQNKMYTYYLVNPITSGTFTFSYPSANCSWNVVSELYNNVDTTTPVDGTTVKVGGNAAGSAPYSFNFNFTTNGPSSLVSIFITSDQIQGSSDKPVSTNLATDMNLLTVGPASVDGGGGEAVAGFYKPAYSPGSQAFTFNLNQANRWWDAQPMEVRGNSCGTPSYTPTFTPAVPTLTPTGTATPSASPTYSLTRSPSPSVTDTDTPGPSPTYTFTRTATPTVTSTVTATPSQTPGPSPTFSSTLTASPTISPTFSPGPSLTWTLSATQTSTPLPSATFTATKTISPTPSISPTFSASPTKIFFNQDRLLQLRGLYPNPFSDTVRAYYTVRVDAQVAMDVYNVAGEPIWSTRSNPGAGKSEFVWDGTNGSQAHCASGVYLLHFRATGVDNTTDDVWAEAVIAR